MPNKGKKLNKKAKLLGGVGVGGLAVADRMNMTSDEDYDTADNMSVISSQSETRSITEEGSGGIFGDSTEQVDEISAQEEFEEKLKDCIDLLSDKSAKSRENALKGLITAFSKKYLIDFLSDRCVTVGDSLEKCLKKGKGEEQALAAHACMLLSIQLGLGALGEEFYKTIKPVLITIMVDKSAAIKARAKCAEAAGLLCFIASGDLEAVLAMMESFEGIFKASYLKGDGSPAIVTPQDATLHCSALSAWSLLLSVASPNMVAKIIETHLLKLPGIMESGDVDLRIVAGEAVAMLYELARESDEDFEGEDLEFLCQRLKTLATDSNKYRAKKDRRQQRSSFRDILRAVEEGEAPELSIKFAHEVLYIETWVHKRQYDALCHVMGTGMNNHLQENELIRDIFGLGSPVPLAAAKLTKASKVDRHMFNAAAFKARTKARAKVRDKRFVHAAY
ncbi:interferon-related developmental regulator 2-like [Tubulanus polymorphus]|uniref:interferon-related developmental regulator 2-like n=1 Tax=Tubulanus polymorphus TaxID=672921 RepID=UPI003DA2E956